MAVQLLKWPGFHLPWIVLMAHISVDTGGLSFYFRFALIPPTCFCAHSQNLEHWVTDSSSYRVATLPACQQLGFSRVDFFFCAAVLICTVILIFSRVEF